MFIEPGSPWVNGYVESFSGKLRDEKLNCRIFNQLAEARVLIERWRQVYNRVRRHSSSGYLRPAAEAVAAPQPAATAEAWPWNQDRGQGSRNTSATGDKGA